MKYNGKWIKVFVAFMLSMFLFFAGCNSNDILEHGKTPTNANVAGQWIGYHVSDNNGEKIETNTLYSLQISQSDAALNATLDIDDNITAIQVVLSGQIIGNDFNLTGTFMEDKYHVEGVLENNTSIQVNIVKNFDLNDTLHMEVSNILMHTADMLGEIITHNKYKFNKKCGDSTTNTIVLVHGLNSTEGIWDTLINKFEKDICKKYSVWTYQYDWTKHIDINGQDMKIRVNSNIPNSNPIIIAHSLGGLVSRSYIGHHGIFSKLITLATPHEGVDLAVLARFIPYSDADSLKDIDPTSSFFSDLNSNVYEQSQHGKYIVVNGIIDHEWICTKKVGHYCVWGHHKWTGDYPSLIKAGYFALTKPNDGVVPQYSSRFDSSSDVKRSEPSKKFKWICHDWLPFKSKVMDYIIEQID